MLAVAAQEAVAPEADQLVLNVCQDSSGLSAEIGLVVQIMEKADDPVTQADLLLGAVPWRFLGNGALVSGDDVE